MAVLNVHQYLSQNGKILRRRIKETSKALELHRCTVERIINRGFVEKSKRGENFKTLVKQSGVDSYYKSLIDETIYGFYCENVTSKLNSLHGKLTHYSPVLLIYTP